MKRTGLQTVTVRPLLALIALGTVAIGAPAAPAQSLPEARAEITAQAFEPVPVGTRIELRLADDSDQNKQLGAVAEEALAQAGFVLDNSNPTVTLRLETKFISAGDREDNSIGSLSAGTDSGVDLNVRLWSSTRNSLLNRNVDAGESQSVFVILLEAFDEVARKPAWRGEAQTIDADSGDLEAGSAIIRALVPALGRTVKRTVIPLR